MYTVMTMRGAECSQLELEFTATYRANVDAIFGYISRHVSFEAETAFDLTADVFEAAAKAYKRGDSRQVTTAWLFAVARRRVIDWWRREATKTRKAPLLRAQAVMKGSVDGEIEHRVLVNEALSQLSARRRFLVVERYLVGTPTDEIADSLGKPLTAVRSEIQRARRAFMDAYEAISVYEGAGQ